MPARSEYARRRVSPRLLARLPWAVTIGLVRHPACAWPPVQLGVLRIAAHNLRQLHERRNVR
jgi:hypothetical protein